MPAKVSRIALDEALSMLRAVTKPAPAVGCPTRLSVGCTLAEDVVAAEPYPKYHVSDKDGFGVPSALLKTASKDRPTKLRVVGTCAPGVEPKVARRGASCVRILTGAYLPAWCDSVVMQEDTVVDGANATFSQPAPVGANVYRAGSDVGRGETIFRRGHVVGPQDAGLLMSCGIYDLKVAPRLKIGVLATGSELVERPSAMRQGKVLETNRAVLLSLLSGLGFSAHDGGLVKDDIATISKAIGGGAARYDAVITTGGSSVGGRDMVADAIERLDGTKLFHGIRLRPSSTAGSALVNGRPVFVLSGLIQSSIVAVCSLVLPTLRHMQGLGGAGLATVQARLDRGVETTWSPSFARAIWVGLRVVKGGLHAKPFSVSSHSKRVISEADGFFLAHGDVQLRAGSLVDVRLPFGFRAAVAPPDGGSKG